MAAIAATTLLYYASKLTSNVGSLEQEGRQLGSCKVQRTQLATFTGRNKSRFSRLGAARPGEAVETPSDSPLAPFRDAVTSQTTHGSFTRLSTEVSKPTIGSLNKLHVTTKESKLWIEEIRWMLQSMNDLEISMSPYDTSWVSLIGAIDGSKGPQFPQCLQWIITNQLLDGSWGDADYFSIFDRSINTLGCIIALKTWDIGGDSIERGLNFLQNHVEKVDLEGDVYIPVGFEIAFSTMLTQAQRLSLDLPYNASTLLKINDAKEKKLKRIPIDILYKFPTTFLRSLESIHEEVNWDEILKLQSEDGSFLNSPASTAACVLHTNDKKALAYLDSLLNRFNDAVPNVYPMDLFEHMRIIDHLQCLGIDRYFKKEIKDALTYLYPYYLDHGIIPSRKANLHDIAMGFRLLRLHGFNISENMFKQFQGKNGEFFSFVGQSHQTVSGMLSFYRAVQTRYPGEVLLEAGELFTRDFLIDKHAKNECFDWPTAKDLSGEVGYALAAPWYYNFAHMEHQSYIDHYSQDEILMGKSHFRKTSIINNTFLLLAKVDFKLCQSIHQQELQTILKWHKESKFGALTFARQKSYDCYFTAACCLTTPELAAARLNQAKTCVFLFLLDDFFDIGGSIPDMLAFVMATKKWDPSLMDGTTQEAKLIFNELYICINEMTNQGFVAQGRDIGQNLQTIWVKWLESCMKEAKWRVSRNWPSFQEYVEVASQSVGLEVINLCSIFFMGELISDELINGLENTYILGLVNRLSRLHNDIQGYKRETAQNKPNSITILLRENPDWSEEEAITKIRKIAQEDMQNLVRQVHRSSDISISIKQLYFEMARMIHIYYQHNDGASSMMKPLVMRVLGTKTYI